jgi:hypothetical protein
MLPSSSVLCELCTAIAQIDRRLRLKFSFGKTDEFISVSLAGGKERSQNATALWGHLPAIGAWDFSYKFMSVQQSQSAGDLCDLPQNKRHPRASELGAKKYSLPHGKMTPKNWE